MAEQTLDEEHAEIKKRAVRRIIVAGALVAASVVALTILNHKPEERPAPVPEAPAPVIAAPEPVQSAPEQETSAEAQPAETPAPELPSVSDSETAPGLPPPPPPPRVVNNSSHNAPAAAPQAGNRDIAPQPKPVAPQAVTISPAPAPKKTVEPVAIGSKPVTAPPAKATEPVAPKGYVVQLGLFSNYENAVQLQKRLAEHGIKSYTETRLHVGPFQNKAEADQAMAKIRSMGINAVLAPAH